MSNVIVPGSEGTGRLRTLNSSELVCYSHVHLIQCRKRQRTATEPGLGFGEFGTSSGVRVVGSISQCRSLKPSFDESYRRILKSRQEIAMRPGPIDIIGVLYFYISANHTILAPVEKQMYGKQSEMEGEHHLFKFYTPGSTEGAMSLYVTNIHY